MMVAPSTPKLLPLAIAILSGSSFAVVESFQSPASPSLATSHRQIHQQKPKDVFRVIHPSPSIISTFPRQLHPLLFATSSIEDDNNLDPLISKTSNALRSASWFSWWAQVILTVISSVTFLFARNVMDAQVIAAGPLELSKVAGKFFLPGLGVIASSISIVWTWGSRRLARRFARRANTMSRVEAANLLRRVIKVGVTLNLLGLLTSVLGAQYIVGTLVAKSMSSFVGFGGGLGGFGGAGAVASQTLQPLDVLVVQANTNVLSSHFVSLACLLWLTRMVDLLDPPSLEDDE